MNNTLFLGSYYMNDNIKIFIKEQFINFRNDLFQKLTRDLSNEIILFLKTEMMNEIKSEIIKDIELIFENKLNNFNEKICEKLDRIIEHSWL